MRVADRPVDFRPEAGRDDMTPGMRRAAAPVVALAVALAGCQTLESNPKASLGSALGAASGGLIAAAAGGGAAGIVGGVLLGGLLGGAIGDVLDQRDKRMAAETAQRALETQRSGTTSVWRNPDSGHSGTITPTRTYQTASGQYCREYQQTVTIDGKKQQSFGTACRQPDGSWRLQG
jgi:surface antigen